MSTAIRAGAQPRAYPSRRKQQKHVPTRRLRLVVPPIAQRGMPFGTVLIVLLTTGLLSVLLANIYISHTTYRVDALTEKNQELTSERDRLAEDISYRQSPQNIQRAAKELGMKQDLTPTFVMPDGSFIEAQTKPDQESENGDTSVPAPRADAREDVRPNLRSNDTLPAIGNDGGSDLDSPVVKHPN